MGWKETVQSLELIESLRAPAICAAVDALHLPLGSKGVDIGCGLGQHSVYLSRAVGNEGRVTCFDYRPEFLEECKKRAEVECLKKQLSFIEGDLAGKIPFHDNTFDWVWSCDCVGYGDFNTDTVLKELYRITKSGGTIALLAWTSETLLQGYPGLEAALKGTSQGLSPFKPGGDPEDHFLRMNARLRRNGFERVVARTFIDNTSIPPNDEQLAALKLLFEMRWKGAEKELAGPEKKLFKGICSGSSSDAVFTDPDYYAFITYTMFWAKVVK